MKYLRAQVAFQEVPEEVSLAIEVTGCPNGCPGCHSPELRGDAGNILDPVALDYLIEKNLPFITTVLFLGGDHSEVELLGLLRHIRDCWGLKTALYTGSSVITEKTLGLLDYMKLGPYVEALGGLESPTTNQRFYKRVGRDMQDMTALFAPRRFGLSH